MKYFLLLLACGLVIFSSGASAASPDIISTPICSMVYNSSDHKVFGSMETDTFEQPDGTILHYKKVLALEPKERVEVCSTGPFFPGRKLELTLRSLVPLFSCRTRLGREIVIHGQRQAYGDYKSWADCFE